MTIFIINGKAHIAVSSGFEPIPTQMYYEMTERSEIERVIEIEHD